MLFDPNVRIALKELSFSIQMLIRSKLYVQTHQEQKCIPLMSEKETSRGEVDGSAYS